jgi:hypothetical protein
VIEIVLLREEGLDLGGEVGVLILEVRGGIAVELGVGLCVWNLCWVVVSCRVTRQPFPKQGIPKRKFSKPFDNFFSLTFKVPIYNFIILHYIYVVSELHTQQWSEKKRIG